MSSKLDFVTDQSLSYIPVIHPHLPDFVKSAAMLSEDDLLPLSRQAFADPVNRRHPIHTKMAVVMSGAYLASKGVDDESVEMKRVKEAARLFKIDSDLNRVLDSLRKMETTKYASTNTTYKPSYALHIKSAGLAGEETVEGYYPLTSYSQTQNAARDIVRDYNARKLPLEFFKVACQETVKAASYHGVDTDDLIPAVVEMTDEREVDFDKAEQLITLRKYAFVKTEELTAYRDLVKAAAAKEIPVDDAILLIEQLDVALNVKYAGLQQNPYLVFHNGPKQSELRKMAETNVIIAGVLVPAETLANIPEKQLATYFSGEPLEVCKKAVKSASINTVEATEQILNLETEAQKDLLNVIRKTLTL